MSSVLLVAPYVAVLAGVDYKYIAIYDLYIYFIPVTVCVILMIYFYVKINFKIRRRQVSQLNQFNARNLNSKIEKKVATTTMTVTVAMFVSVVPTISIFFLRDKYPAIQERPFKLFAMATAQLNSLTNPLVYFYRNPPLKNAALDLLRLRTRLQRWNARHGPRDAGRENPKATLEQEARDGKHHENVTNSPIPGDPNVSSKTMRSFTLERPNSAPKTSTQVDHARHSLDCTHK